MCEVEVSRFYASAPTPAPQTQTTPPTTPARDTHVYKTVDGRELEADVIGAHFLDATGLFVQQHADFDPARLEAPEFFGDALEGAAGVEDVVHQQHVAPAHIKAQFLGEDQFARLGARAVARNAHEIQPQRQL